ncbi:MAG: RCC1 repeat-containing protein, partial [Myxococcales bacterium]|nr:RCC1 repeat-containing protein [Myxococcales bacterium]
ASQGQVGQAKTGSFQDTAAPVDGLPSEVRAISAGGSHSCALMNGGAVKCWGSTIHHATGHEGPSPADVGGLSDAKAIATGEDFSCAVTSDGHVQCWGENTYGQLGSSDALLSSTAPVTVEGF